MLHVGITTSNHYSMMLLARSQDVPSIVELRAQSPAPALAAFCLLLPAMLASAQRWLTYSQGQRSQQLAFPALAVSAACSQSCLTLRAPSECCSRFLVYTVLLYLYLPILMELC